MIQNVKPQAPIQLQTTYSLKSQIDDSHFLGNLKKKKDFIANPNKATKEVNAWNAK